MNLRTIRSNMTELQLSGGLTLLFSYQTPVACRWTNGIRATYSKTQKRWSATTTRHISMWVGDEPVTVRPQEYFDALVKGV